MRSILHGVLFMVLSPLAPVCQGIPDGSAQAHLQAAPIASASPVEVWIPQDMQVQFRLLEGLSTATDHKAYVVHLEVASDVVSDGVVIVPAGTRRTAKLTHSDSKYIAFSAPTLMASGQKVRLSEHTSQERGELGAEEGAAIGIAIFAAPVIAIELPLAAVVRLVHCIRSDHHKAAGPKRVITAEPGEIFTYYTFKRTLVRIAEAGAAAP
jgi:hypothetical protein